MSRCYFYCVDSNENMKRVRFDMGHSTEIYPESDPEYLPPALSKKSTKTRKRKRIIDSDESKDEPSSSYLEFYF